jgi:trk system potassium uptake protein TrkA
VFIIIAGGGKVGSALARDLLAAENELVVIERNHQKALDLEDEFGSCVLAQDASEGRWLLSAGIKRADLVIAVTGDDEDNIVICQLSRALSKGITRTIARINNPKNSDTFRLLGIESIVNATDLVMSTIERDVSVAPIVHLLRLQAAGLELVELPVTAGSAAAGTTIGDLNLPEHGGRVTVLLRDREVLFPSPDTKLEEGDTLVAVIQSKREEQLRSLFATAPGAPPPLARR